MLVDQCGLATRFGNAGLEGHLAEIRVYRLYRSDGTTPLSAAELPASRARKGESVDDLEVAFVMPWVRSRRGTR